MNKGMGAFLILSGLLLSAALPALEPDPFGFDPPFPESAEAESAEAESGTVAAPLIAPIIAAYGEWRITQNMRKWSADGKNGAVIIQNFEALEAERGLIAKEVRAAIEASANGYDGIDEVLKRRYSQAMYQSDMFLRRNGVESLPTVNSLSQGALYEFRALSEADRSAVRAVLAKTGRGVSKSLRISHVARIMGGYIIVDGLSKSYLVLNGEKPGFFPFATLMGRGGKQAWKLAHPSIDYDFPSVPMER